VLEGVLHFWLRGTQLAGDESDRKQADEQESPKKRTTTHRPFLHLFFALFIFGRLDE
jgi:hypothetical protein